MGNDVSRAVNKGDADRLRQLLENGARLDAKKIPQWTLRSSRNGYDECLQLLLTHNPDANVDVKDDDGWPAIIWAANNGHTKCVDVLIANGADVNATTDWGRTALMWAVERGHEACARTLIDHGAKLNTKDRDGGYVRRTTAV
jgi:ankyrin repeat protein